MGITEIVNLIVRINNAATRNLKEFTNALGASQDTLENMNKSGFVFTSTGQKVGNRVRLLTTGMRSFKMEMLSVLFFGMGLKAMFMGLLQPAFDMVGIFDLLNTTLGILFLPTALQVLNQFMLPFLDLVLQMSPEMQKLIGTVALLGVAIGTLLFFVGFLTLGVGGLLTAFGPVITAIGAVIGVGLLPLLLILGIVAAVVYAFRLAWEENFGNIREWTQVIFEGIANIFKGLMEVIGGIVDIIVGFFSGDTQRILEGAKRLWDGIKQLGLGLLQFIIGLVVSIGLAVFRAFLNILAVLIDLLGKGFGKIWEFITGGAVEFGKNLVMSIVDGILSVAHFIAEALWDALPEWAQSAISGVASGISNAIDNASSLVGLATGGVVTRPTPALVGEAGPEAVIPLDQLSGIGSSSIYITVNANVANDIDLDVLARKIGQEVSTQKERSLRR